MTKASKFVGGHDLLGTPGYAYGSMHQPAWNRAEKTWYNHNGAFARRVFVATKEKRIFLVSWRLESADFEWHCPICPAQQTKRSKQPLWHNNYGIAVVWNKCQYSVYGHKQDKEKINKLEPLQGRSVTEIWGRDEGKNINGWLQNAKQHGAFTKGHPV